MSLESAISDLVNSTNALNTNVQNTLSTVNSQISALNGKILNYNTTINVGPGKQFTDLQAAINYVYTSVIPIGSVINIQLSDGAYNLTNISYVGYYIINIWGNTTDPTKVVLNTNALKFSNVQMSFSNLTIQNTLSGNISSFLALHNNPILRFTNVNFIVSVNTWAVFILFGPRAAIEFSGVININSIAPNPTDIINFAAGKNTVTFFNGTVFNSAIPTNRLFHSNLGAGNIFFFDSPSVTFNLSNVDYLFYNQVNLSISYAPRGSNNAGLKFNCTNCNSLVYSKAPFEGKVVGVTGTFNTSATKPLISLFQDATFILEDSDVNSTDISNSKLANVSTNSRLYLKNNTFTDFNTGIYAEINSLVDARTNNTFTNVNDQFSPSTPFTYGNNNSVILA